MVDLICRRTSDPTANEMAKEINDSLSGALAACRNPETMGLPEDSAPVEGALTEPSGAQILS
jgi:hypothetical protein